ncbi:MAG: hypothetical protein K2G91_05985 [Prevotella sp.]|nr:hypothetical protein [Prevotella sp.]
MKKQILLLIPILIAIFCINVSCSNDDEVDNAIESCESRLSILKLQYLKYAAEYGVDPQCLYFRDDKMKKHLDMTEADVEREIAEIASHFGIKNSKTEKYNKRRTRKRTISMIEPDGCSENGVFYGSFSDVYMSDSLKFSMKCSFEVRPYGTDAFHLDELFGYIIKKNSNGVIVSENPLYIYSYEGRSGSISGENTGRGAHYGISYQVFVSFYDGNDSIVRYSFPQKYDYTYYSF